VYCVLDRETRHPLGIVNVMNFAAQHLKAELGFIWYGVLAQRTGVNREACLLLIEFLFETYCMRRVEWKCDSLNQRSRNAAERLGFVFEAIQQSHMIARQRNRDTAWFRILHHEWPALKAKHAQ
jgi:RimJ/RimL family protein N-acetyltransferase